MQKVLQKKNKGFTLIELMMVVAIIAILALGIAAAYSVARRRAIDGRIRSDMQAIRTAMELSTSEETGLYSMSGDLPAAEYFESGAQPEHPLDGVSYKCSLSGDSTGYECETQLTDESTITVGAY